MKDLSIDQTYADFMFAQQVQAKELCLQERQEEAEKAMASSSTGRAWQLVEKVLELHKEFVSTLSPDRAALINPVAIDDMFFLAQKMFEKQQEFRAAKKPWQVDLGYHFTDKKNLASIRAEGLLSNHEREAKKVKPTEISGSAYGQGVYTGEDHDFCSQYGDIGFLVARLKGVQMRHTHAKKGYTNKGNDSII
jgi:hypothetical protein